MAGRMPKSAGRKSLNAASNLANLLPTGTVLAFQALVPSFSNNGSCLAANKYLTLCIIIICSVVCFFSSFTDSFIGCNGKLYYGIATTKGIYIFNKDDYDDDDDHGDKEMGSDEEKRDEKERNCINKLSDNNTALARYAITSRDFVHAFSSLVVFLVFAIDSTDVQNCFFPHSGSNGNQLMINLPLGVSALASLLFLIFPTKRRGIGYAEEPRSAQNAIRGTSN